ncbi:FHA domain-containing protein, partial [Microbacterium sp. ZW T2_14]|uniref:FHA domain-containing protein n=1 Tax=Microbacterium sp. ZW T2_14 TaxID=3378079 RepID=UPI003853022F
PDPAIADPEPAAASAPGPENPAPSTPAVPAAAGPEAVGEPPVRGPWSSRVASDGPVAPVGPPVAGLIDSSAVASVVDAETLLPLDSALSPHAAGAAGAGTATGAPDSAGARGEEEFASTTGYDHLWGATVIRSVEDAAVRPEGEDDGEAPAPSDGAAPAGDHDGATISLAQARALRDAANGGAGAAGSAELPAEGIASPLAPPRPPAPGRIRVSTGQVLPLDRTVVIGRRPRSTRVSGTDLPHLVAVDSPEQDISRSHVELRVEGESIVATDLRTTNGTTLLRSGADPVRLHPGEGTIVVPGDVLDLGDGITVAIEALT